MPVGAEMGFRPETFPIGSPPGEYTVDNWDHFQGILLQVMVIDDATLFVHGSAVLVAPGVALAARHVIEPFLSRLSIEGGATLLCGSITASQLMMWHCRKITFVENSDLAILILNYCAEMPIENIFKTAAITTWTPKIGEQVSMIGFTAAHQQFPFQPDGASPLGHASIVGHVRVSVGEVTHQHLRGRDRVMMPGPTIEVASSASGGMSGGPVFDQNGFLVGIVSTSFGTVDHVGPSYVSLLWHALTTPIDAEWPNGIHRRGCSLLELDPLCSIDRRDALRRTSDTSFEYSYWE
jgi:hypothetical protein